MARIAWKKLAIICCGLACVFSLKFLLNDFIDKTVKTISQRDSQENKKNSATKENDQNKNQPVKIAHQAPRTPSPEIQKFDDNTITKSLEIKKNSTFFDTLVREGISPSLVLTFVNLAKSIYDLAHIKAQSRITIKRLKETKELIQIEIPLSLQSVLMLSRKNDGEWIVRKIQKKIEIRQRIFSGIIRNSLWESAKEAGLDSAVIFQLADIFAWQIDFDRETQPGDDWVIIVNQQLIEGNHFDWAPVTAARYRSQSQSYWAIQFSQGQKAYYFDLKGNNLQGQFLRSPLKFSRISSRFRTMRFHPILGLKRPHYGVDYAAPRGTPVRSVGEGRILFVGRRGGSGKMIKIRHNSQYQTAYKHLDGYAKKIRRGNKIIQGQVIGFVGSTGLATGPHLHFEFYEHGKYVDPLGKHFPLKDPVKLKNKETFQQRVAEILPLFPQRIKAGEVIAMP